MSYLGAVPAPYQTKLSYSVSSNMALNFFVLVNLELISITICAIPHNYRRWKHHFSHASGMIFLPNYLLNRIIHNSKALTMNAPCNLLWQLIWSSCHNNIYCTCIGNKFVVLCVVMDDLSTNTCESKNRMFYNNPNRSHADLVLGDNMTESHQLEMV